MKTEKVDLSLFEGDSVESVVGETDPPSADEQESGNRELIGKKIRNLGWEETQHLVAGILRAMGYSTEVSPSGPDGGRDIIACQDPLFLQPPLVKVQVKARPETKSPPSEVRARLGLLDTDDRAIFVSTGGFTAIAEREVNDDRRIQLFETDRLLDLFLEHYDSLDKQTKALVPLRQIWVSQSDASE